MPPMLAIDPGPVQSAWVQLADDQRILGKDLEPNLRVLARIHASFLLYPTTHVAIERIKARGMRLGDDTLQTCEWVGRFQQICGGDLPCVHLCYRPEIVHWITHGAPQANDASVRRCILDYYGPSRDQAIGTKTRPGPLYGVRRDVWQALAVALYAQYHLDLGTLPDKRRGTHAQ